MSTKKSLLTLTLGTILFASIAQTPIIFNQFFLEKSLYNPAYAGTTKAPTATFLYNNRYNNVKGSPENFCLAFSSPIPNQNAGGGGYYNRNNIGLMTNEEINLNYAYSLKINDKIKFHLGAGGGLYSIKFNLNAADLAHPNDPKLLAIQNTPPKSNVNIRFGTAITTENFSLGFSANRLLKQDYFYEYNAKTLTYSVQKFFTVDMNYMLTVAKNHYINPYINTFYSNNNKKVLFTGGAAYNYQKKFWIGAGTYNMDNIHFYMGLLLSDAFKIGVSRIVPLKNGANKLGASNEIGVSIILGRGKRLQALKDKEKADADTVFAIKDRVIVKDRIITDTIVEKVYITKKGKNKDNVFIDVKRKKKPILYGEGNQLKPTQLIQFDDIKKMKPAELIKMDTSKVVFRDVSKIELEEAHYVIIGVYQVQKYADNFLKKLLKRGIGAYKIYRKDKNYFYIILDKTKDLSKAEVTRNNNADNFPGVWIYTVSK